ncbi:MAG: ATP-binding cassette domain-containing protein, partial [Gammaproteobacteria bacterium]|nr:ATP-binding cassette domain-containing protein [Gammaproteobacteria bacterium]
LVLVIGIYITLVIWELPIASVLVLGFLLFRTLKRSGQVQRNYQKMVVSESAYWSIQDTIEQADLAREALSGDREPVFESVIELRDVTFSYGDENLLDSMSLEIPVGSFTALIGQSGSGKTTNLDLISGLLQPMSGTVSIDGTPLAELNVNAWRRTIGYVPQENVLLHDTVINNVTLGDPELDESDAVRALRQAGAWEFVSRLPQGVQQKVGERGGKLSGGQRQRVMIARALAHRPKLLILDEATTALDPESEMAIYKTLRALRGEHTILAISHQPALLEAADRIYRLRNGKAVLERAG